jgi:5-methylcytosine-specific restriction enzyme A
MPRTVPPRPPDARTDKNHADRRKLSYQELVTALGEDSGSGTGKTTKQATTCKRKRRAREAVLARADDQCANDRCTGMAPDVTRTGRAILEVDHVDDLALGGKDFPSGMIALCPNCHAAKTRGRNRATMRRHLRKLAARLHSEALQEP